MWREAMMDLLDQLEAENPEDSSLAPQDFPEWACIYIKYVQIFRKLEHAYDQMVHPQKLVDMKKALEACMGRMLEVRHWLVKLNKNMDFMNIDDILVDLKLTPGELEIPVPRCFKQDNAKVCMCWNLLSFRQTQVHGTMHHVNHAHCRADALGHTAGCLGNCGTIHWPARQNIPTDRI